jgi:hypothetical protein
VSRDELVDLALGYPEKLRNISDDQRMSFPVEAIGQTSGCGADPTSGQLFG